MTIPKRYIYPVAVVCFMVFFRLSCLEKVTGQPIPLDPAFYEAAEAARGDPGQGGGASRPFANYSGDMITLSGVVDAEDKTLAIDIDFRTPDATAPGGIVGQGKLLLEEPGAFSLSVPTNTSIEIQAFQDIDADGPSGMDPFGQVNIETEEEDISDVMIQLVAGGRETNEHQVVNPQQGDGPSEAGQGVPENPDPFGGVGGSRVSLYGYLDCDCSDRIDLDLFQPDNNSPGGRRMIGKLKLDPGEYEIMVPEDYGSLILEAFIDADGDGPGAGDKMGIYRSNPVYVGSSDVYDIDITLAVTDDGKMPQ